MTDKVKLFLIVACGIPLASLSINVSAKAQADDINQCKNIVDSAKRLACFDKITNAELPKSTDQTQDTAEALDDIDKRAKALMEKAQNADNPFAPNAPRISADNNRTLRQVDDSFGAQSLPKGSPKAVDEIQTSINSMVRDKRGYATITLNNGQVWQQTETARFTFEEGDNISIEKGVFNSFYLSKLNNNRSVRVKRIQ